MFFGEYRHNIDAKGRLSIPAKMRLECIDNKVVVVRGHDECLELYTTGEWLKFYKEQMTLNRKKKKNRDYMRLLGSRVCECEFDKLGRINIPANLRDEGHLKKECVIIGIGETAEIWDRERWDSFYGDNRDSFDDLSEDIGDDEE